MTTSTSTSTSISVSNPPHQRSDSGTAPQKPPSAMEAIEQLLTWATSNGVILDGIAPRSRPGRGIGLVATRNLEANRVVLTVPTNLLRSLANTPKPVTRKLKGATVHAILATALCLDLLHGTAAAAAAADEDKNGDDTTGPAPLPAPWKAVLPTPHEISTSMPLSWPAPLQALLPPAARHLLAHQSAKFAADWALVSAAHPLLSREAYLHAWHLVNSRTFYHTTRLTARTLPRDDHMVLQPVADLFNHAPDDTACHVAFDAQAYTFTTRKGYAPGEELFIRYGSHSNDFLLVEYGFALPGALNRRWDEICLDPYLCPRFTARQSKTLEEAGFWGKYMLDSETACYRAQTALRLLCLPEARWRAVLEGRRDEDADADAVNAELLSVLRTCGEHVDRNIVELHRCVAGNEQTRATLRQRWLQIRELVVTTMARLQG